MSKWKNVPEKRRKEIYAYNAARAADRETAQDFKALLDAMPQGVRKQLEKDETCAAILNKYGVTG